MAQDRERTLLSLLEWREQQQRWESIPEEARQAFIEVLADLMIRVAAREQDDDGTDHG